MNRGPQDAMHRRRTPIRATVLVPQSLSCQAQRGKEDGTAEGTTRGSCQRRRQTLSSALPDARPDDAVVQAARALPSSPRRARQRSTTDRRPPSTTPPPSRHRRRRPPSTTTPRSHHHNHHGPPVGTPPSRLNRIGGFHGLIEIFGMPVGPSLWDLCCVYGLVS